MRTKQNVFVFRSLLFCDQVDFSSFFFLRVLFPCFLKYFCFRFCDHCFGFNRLGCFLFLFLMFLSFGCGFRVADRGSLLWGCYRSVFFRFTLLWREVDTIFCLPATSRDIIKRYGKSNEIFLWLYQWYDWSVKVKLGVNDIIISIFLFICGEISIRWVACHSLYGGSLLCWDHFWMKVIGLMNVSYDRLCFSWWNYGMVFFHRITKKAWLLFCHVRVQPLALLGD